MLFIGFSSKVIILFNFISKFARKVAKGLVTLIKAVALVKVKPLVEETNRLVEVKVGLKEDDLDKGLEQEM